MRYKEFDLCLEQPYYNANRFSATAICDMTIPKDLVPLERLVLNKRVIRLSQLLSGEEPL